MENIYPCTQRNYLLGGTVGQRRVDGGGGGDGGLVLCPARRAAELRDQDGRARGQGNRLHYACLLCKVSSVVSDPYDFYMDPDPFKIFFSTNNRHASKLQMGYKSIM